jgi:hypothetical protein
MWRLSMARKGRRPMGCESSVKEGALDTFAQPQYTNIIEAESGTVQDCEDRVNSNADAIGKTREK